MPHILFYNNGLAIWHGFPDIKHSKDSFPDITHIKVNNGRKSAILKLIELKFFRA